ncbi:DUF2062 domain-containing protein [Nitratidesulfovibrio sp. 1201_IL3209]|uniref:DUF2062 domain-containing protein n=1 Tax=Nitratidesulfovibrio sp. 1201_IL3209 TaxID=3084053 RepID=UPI002FDAED49
MEWRDRLRRWTRFQYLRLMRQSASPHSLAMGLAVGVFVGFLPIIPFQTVVSLALAFVLRGNPVGAAIGTFVSNPLNVIPFYAMLYWVGGLFRHTEVAFDPANLDMARMLELGLDFFLVMCLGGVVLGVPAAFVTYVLTFRGVNAYRQRRTIKLLRAWQARRDAEAAPSGQPTEAGRPANTTRSVDPVASGGHDGDCS